MASVSKAPRSVDRKLPKKRKTSPVAKEIVSAPLPTVADSMAWKEQLQVSWPIIGWLALLHVGALFAPWTFSWSGLAIVVFMHWLCGSIGICLGYHRLLTHDGFRVPEWLRRSVTLVGTLAGEGGPLSWTANHRKHHAFSDREGDPHSPKHGPWWSHLLWLGFETHDGDQEAYWRRWVPDLYRDPFLRLTEKLFLPINLGVSVLLTGAGYWLGGTSLALSWLVWGVCLRMVLVLHTTWFVNSASHMWGYKNYDAKDDSRNLWWVALIAYGEGWHNNHHAHPRLAQHGHRWWEIDTTYWVIRGLKAMGLVTDLVDLESQQAKAAEHRARREAIPAVAAMKTDAEAVELSSK